MTLVAPPIATRATRATTRWAVKGGKALRKPGGREGKDRLDGDPGVEGELNIAWESAGINGLVGGEDAVVLKALDKQWHRGGARSRELPTSL